jgi:hypothetical protein
MRSGLTFLISSTKPAMRDESRFRSRNVISTGMRRAAKVILEAALDIGHPAEVIA